MRDTLSYMRTFAEDYKIHPVVRTLALSLTRTLPQKDYNGEIRALWDYVKNRVRYVRDVRGVETVQTPVKTLEYGQGDCDDKSTLLASMLESLGHLTRFRAVGFGPRNLCHVLVDVYDDHNKKWIALETTENVNLGWTPPGVVNEMIEGVHGLNGNIFGKLKKAVKKAGRDFDDTVLQKGAKDLLKNKKFGQVASVFSFIPVVAAVAMASKLVQAHDAKARAKEASAKNEKEMEASLEPRRYVLDPITQEVRLATVFDSGVQQYTVTADGNVTPWVPPTPGLSFMSQEPGTLNLQPQTVARPAPFVQQKIAALTPNTRANVNRWIAPVGAAVFLGFILTR